MRKKKRLTLLDQWMIGVLMIIVTGFIAYGVFVFSAVHPYSKLQAQAIQLAKDHADLVSIDSFSVVTTDETVYSVSGEDQNGQTIGVLIPKDGKEIRLINFDEGVTALSLRAGDNAVNLGVYKGKIIWEVNSIDNFEIYDFKSGEKIR